MATYILSFLFFSFVLSCFYKKRSYENRFVIAIYAAMLSLIPVTAVNLNANNTGERSMITLKSVPLEEMSNISNSNSEDTIHEKIPVYFSADIEEKLLRFRPESCLPKGKKMFSKNLKIHYIEADSLNLPRYEVMAEKFEPSSKSKWISALAVPNTNREVHLYLPNDTTMEILNSAINEAKEADTD